jgi:hypothetical protein
MDAYRIEDCIAQASIGLNRGKLMRIDDARGIEVSVVYGSVWLTQHASTDDVCIGTGESFRIGRDGPTLVSATKPSLVALTLPGAQDRALRVSMIAAGGKPVELFDTGANPKPSRLDAWLDKYWVPLFSASARPTTAAL